MKKYLLHVCFVFLLTIGLAGCAQNAQTKPAVPAATANASANDQLKQSIQTQLEKSHHNVRNLQIVQNNSLGKGVYLVLYLFDEQQTKHEGVITFLAPLTSNHTQMTYSDVAQVDTKAMFTVHQTSGTFQTDQGDLQYQFVGGVVNNPAVHTMTIQFADGLSATMSPDDQGRTYGYVRTQRPKVYQIKSISAFDSDGHLLASYPPYPPQ